MMIRYSLGFLGGLTLFGGATALLASGCGSDDGGGQSESTAAGGSGSDGGSASSGGVASGVAGAEDGETGGSEASGGAGSESGGSSSGANSGGVTSAGGSSQTGGSTSTGGTVDDCTVPPSASTLVGWAAVSGNGTSTTTGGGTVSPVTVSSFSALASAVSGSNAAVVYVTGSLGPGDLEVGSNKTIVGICGAEIRGHMELAGSVNVIIRNLTIVGYGEGDCSLDPSYDSSEGCSSGADAISVQQDAHHIWFDHCDISDGTDGNLDITNGADYVTVSWTKFHYSPRTDNVGADSTGSSGHRYSNLVGGTDTPSYDDANSLNVTWHHNWWSDNVVERMPRVRFGQNHIFNNLYASNTSNYCVRAGIEAGILIEGNYFDGVKSPHQFNSTSDEATAYITADSSNIYDGTSGTTVTGGGGTPFTEPPYSYTLDAAADARTAILSQAGPQ